jgi:hypothetical protein
MYPKAHRVFVACSEAMVRSLADKALKQSNRKPDLECNCQPAIPNIAESSQSACNISLCRIPDCWTPTMGLDGVGSLNVHLCKNGREARLTGITRALSDFGSSPSTPYDRGHQYVTHQYQYTCCTALARHDPTPPPGVAGHRWIGGVEEDMVCPKMYRYRCANVYTPPHKLNLTRHGREVFWRVDSVMTSDGYDMTVVPGPVWSFTTLPPPELSKHEDLHAPLGGPKALVLRGLGVCVRRDIRTIQASVCRVRNNQTMWISSAQTSLLTVAISIRIRSMFSKGLECVSKRWYFLPESTNWG